MLNGAVLLSGVCFYKAGGREGKKRQIPGSWRCRGLLCCSAGGSGVEAEGKMGVCADLKI